MMSIQAANIRGLVFPRTAANIQFRIFLDAKLAFRGKFKFDFWQFAEKLCLICHRRKKLDFYVAT
jgi:hypothetical protein